MRLAVLTLVLVSLSSGLQAAPKRTSKRNHSARQTAQPDTGTVHVMKKGETATQVARHQGLSMAELAALNPGLRLSRLSVGTKLRLDRGTGTLPVADRMSPEPTAPRLPLPPMPASPVFASAPMPHLEQLLPYQIRMVVPAGGTRVAVQGDPDTLSQLLSRLQPVLPSITDAEYQALLPVYTPADPDHLDLLWPVETRTISSAWGPRMRTRTVRVRNQRKKRVRYRGRHKGVDLTAPIGTAVFAAMDGKVIKVGKERGYGNCIFLDHGNGVVTVYAHHSVNLVELGDIVRRGQKIAEVGRTGNATGPHLHFELRLGGGATNPLPFLNDEEEVPTNMAAQNARMGSSLSAGSGSLR